MVGQVCYCVSANFFETTSNTQNAAKIFREPGDQKISFSLVVHWVHTFELLLSAIRNFQPQSVPSPCYSSCLLLLLGTLKRRRKCGTNFGALLFRRFFWQYRPHLWWLHIHTQWNNNPLLPQRKSKKLSIVIQRKHMLSRTRFFNISALGIIHEFLDNKAK